MKSFESYKHPRSELKYSRRHNLHPELKFGEGTRINEFMWLLQRNAMLRESVLRTFSAPMCWLWSTLYRSLKHRLLASLSLWTWTASASSTPSSSRLTMRDAPLKSFRYGSDRKKQDIFFDMLCSFLSQMHHNLLKTIANSIEQNSSLETTLSKEVPGLLWNSQVHYRVNKCLLLVPVLSQTLLKQWSKWCGFKSRSSCSATFRRPSSRSEDLDFSLHSLENVKSCNVGSRNAFICLEFYTNYYVSLKLDYSHITRTSQPKNLHSSAL